MTKDKDKIEIVKTVRMPITQNRFEDYINAIRNMSEFFDKSMNLKIDVIPKHSWNKSRHHAHLFNEDAIDGSLGIGIDAVIDLLEKLMHDECELISWWFFEADDTDHYYTDRDDVTTKIDTIEELWEALKNEYVSYVLAGVDEENCLPYTEDEETDNVNEEDD